MSASNVGSVGAAKGFEAVVAVPLRRLEKKAMGPLILVRSGVGIFPVLARQQFPLSGATVITVGGLAYRPRTAAKARS